MQKGFIGIFVFCIATLGMRLASFYSSDVSLTNGQTLSFQTTIQQGKQRGGLVYYTVKYQQQKPITLVTAFTRQYDFGTEVEVSGKVKESAATTGSALFYTMQYPTITLVKPAGGLTKVTNLIRERISGFYNATLPPIAASLVTGIVFGEKQSMPKQFENSLKKTGVMHVIAASGMNVSLVAGAVLAIFQRLFKRKTAVITTIATIVFYTFLAGLQPSIVRAAFMGSIAFAATLLGRQYTALFALNLAAFVMLFLSPQLLFDIGFQLSFLATAGILLIKPVLDRLLQSEKIKKAAFIQAIAGDLTTTVAAQIATLPILLTAFSSYGLLSIPANMLVLWVVPFILVGGMIAGVISLIFQPFAAALLYVLLPFLLYFEKVIISFGKIDLNVNVENLSIATVVGYYCLIIAILLTLRSGKRV